MALSFPQKMFNFINFPCTNTRSIEEPRDFKSTHETNNNLVYRDDLDKKNTEPDNTKLRSRKKVTFADDKTIESKIQDDTKEVIRVKVKMTKEQADRLLSNCKQGGVLEFKDVAREIAQLPMNRITSIESIGSQKRQAPVFKSIPEEVEF